MKLADFRTTGIAADGRHRAIHKWTGRRVAIEHGANLAGVAAALDAVDHRGIARIVGTGEDWVASEVPDGISLADVMLRRTLAAAELITLLRDASDVLCAAHRAGVVHRGLRPSAIYYGTGPHHAPVIIADWASPVELTVYAAPELGGRHDHRADIYSLAVIAYRAFAGRFPEAETLHVAGLPAPLSRLLVRMLSTDPERRPSAPEVRLHAQRMLEPDRVTAPRARTRWTPVSGMRAIRALDTEEIIELVTKVRARS